MNDRCLFLDKKVWRFAIDLSFKPLNPEKAKFNFSNLVYVFNELTKLSAVSSGMLFPALKFSPRYFKFGKNSMDLNNFSTFTCEDSATENSQSSNFFKFGIWSKLEESISRINSASQLELDN